MEPALKQFLIYLGMTTDGTMRTRLRQVDRTASNMHPGDLMTFSYRLTTGPSRGQTRDYTILAVGGKKDGSAYFTHSSTKNRLFRGYRIDHLSPETLTIILYSIYLGREKLNADFTYGKIEGFLQAVIGKGLDQERYRTFNDTSRGTMTKVELEGLKEAVDSMMEANDG